jgi:glycosyltransferase involved in cell wall biosynthesis
MLLKCLAQHATVDVAALGPVWPTAACQRAGACGGRLIDLTTTGVPRKDLRKRLGPVDFRLAGWRSSRNSLLAHHARRPWDLIVHRYIHAFATLGPLPRAAALVDVDDLPSEVCSSAAPDWTAGPLERPRALIVARRLAAAERGLLALADGLWVSTPTHAGHLGRGDSVLLRNALAWPPADPQPPTTDRPPTALFIGPLWHPPNRRGLAWLKREVWPRVRQRLPHARLLIAGTSGDPPRTSEAGIEHLGFVPDSPGPGGLDWLYQSCDVACAPLFSGSGTSIKVLEALGRGLPCLATPWAARHLEQSSPALGVKEPGAWSHELVEMLVRRQQLGAMARRASKAVRTGHGERVFQKSVDRLLDQVSAAAVS